MPHKNLAERREWQWKRNLRRRYNITPEEYFVIYKKYKGKCILCGHTPDIGHKGLGVDHDHKTGKIRGLLCIHCNRVMVGRLERIGLKKIAGYLGYDIIKKEVH